MTENGKIELFDKWYDENYDEWAEGEEGIDLREELEQAFKGGIEALEKENAELKKSVNNWLKYEKETQYHKSIIKDLKKENAELKAKVSEQSERISELTQELDDSINRFG